MSIRNVYAYPVKYDHIDYRDNCVIIQQNRTIRKVYKGHFFDDNGQYIYVSSGAASMFSHKEKYKIFVLDDDTFEYEEFIATKVVKHRPYLVNYSETDGIDSLKR